jgi:UDP-3-O-[3-hydroxymyristoyl] glucosamine N-acyltransferase
MLLSALKEAGDLEIIKDAAFENLGFVSDPQTRMLTFFESARHEVLMGSLKDVACVITRKELVKSLGSVGLQVSRFPEGVIDMAHAGGIRIGDNVQVMSNAVVAPAVFRQSTTIAKGSRIGNVAFISHNAHLGPRCFVGHGSVINGNVRVGQDAWIGPGAVLCNNITIGAKAHIALGSTVIKNVAPGQRMMGPFATEKQRSLSR